MWKDPLQADKEPLLPQKEKIMAKKVVGKIKLQIEAGKANPSPPVGPALGQHGVNIMDFCKQFNAKTQDKAGYIIPVIIDVYEDRSFTFVIKLEEIAKIKMDDLNATTMDAAVKMIAGSCRAMGVTVKED